MAQSKRPANLAPLSKEAFGANVQPAAATPKSKGHSITRPTQLSLVIGGSGDAKDVDAVTQKYNSQGFGIPPSEGGSAIKLDRIIYERKAHEGVEDTAHIKATLGATNQVPLGLITPLHEIPKAGAPPALPKDANPVHMLLSYSLPSFTTAKALKDNFEDWLKLFAEGSKQNLTFDIALPLATPAANQKEADDLREAVEELLSKAWDEEVQRGKADGKSQEDIASNGLKIVVDGWGAPPLNDDSSQMLSSEVVNEWTGFVRRLALHPRVFLKLSPLKLPSPISSGSTASRAVDIAAPLSGAVGGATIASTAQAALDGAAAAVRTATEVAAGAASAAGLAGTKAVANNTPRGRRDELRARLRVLLDAALEAFGEERLVWSAHINKTSLTAGTDLASQIAGEDEEYAKLSPPEKWFEVTREALADMGLTEQSLNNIFNT
ncbi:hypothetical protein IE81DRAFT_332768, partial [Ceraceosorus guamensis]